MPFENNGTKSFKKKKPQQVDLTSPCESELPHGALKTAKICTRGLSKSVFICSAQRELILKWQVPSPQRDVSGKCRQSMKTKEGSAGRLSSQMPREVHIQVMMKTTICLGFLFLPNFAAAVEFGGRMFYAATTQISSSFNANLQHLGCSDLIIDVIFA